MEDQATMQSNPETTDITAPETTASPSAEVDVKAIGKITNEHEQIEALKAAGILGEKPTPPTPAPEPEPTPEPSTEPEAKEDETKPEEQSQEIKHKIKVNGEEKEVSYDELIKLAQQGSDYTRKTQELAAERKRYDELLSKLNTQPQATAPAPEAKDPKDVYSAQYEAATHEVERRLGLKRDEFNQFDATHTFVLNQVVQEQQQAANARNQLNSEIAEFARQAQLDPMTPEIDANFDRFIFELGKKEPEKAMNLVLAKSRFMSGNASRADAEAMKAHWNYVKAALETEKNTPPPPTPTPTPMPKKVEPPKTEAPGPAVVTAPRPKLDKNKLRSLSADQDSQISMLKKLGIL